jgi:hypothetical protein
MTAALLDLLRAAPVALLVVFAPGYPWARWLCDSADRVRRLAYALALSLTLVPLVAYFPARLLGLGVTLPVAVGAPCLVGAAGMAAWRRWGSPVEPQRCLGGCPPTLAPAALLPLGLGAALLAWATFAGQAVPWLAGAVAALLLAAVALHLLGSRRGWAGPEHGPGLLGRPGAWRALLLGAVLLALVRGYSGVVRHDWPYIRGVDQYAHTIMTDLVLASGSEKEFMLYPPGFHTLSAILSRLSGLGPLELYATLGPALLALPVLGVYTLGSRLWGRGAGALGALCAGALLPSPYLYLNDAMYPNLIAAQFLMPLALGELARLVAGPSARAGLLFALLGAAVVQYHTVATLYLAALLAPLSLVFLPLLLRRDRRAGVALLAALSALGALSLFYAWDPYSLPQTLAGLLGLGGTNEAVASGVGAIGTQPVHTPRVMLLTLGQPVAWLGLLGGMLTLATPWRGGAPQALARVCVLAWAALLFAGSRTSLSGFPHRFERDLGVPLALLAGYALLATLSPVHPRRPLLLAAAAPLAVLLSLQGWQNLEAAAAPSRQLLLTPGIEAAGRWLREHNTGGNILVSPKEHQVPSRAMLAMGRYTALQSYADWQLKPDERRDLPRSGLQPLQDALWMLRNPADERTRELLRQYDVRYIVIYKRFPERTLWSGKPKIDWRPFKLLTDRYRVEYENEDVLIVAPS